MKALSWAVVVCALLKFVTIEGCTGGEQWSCPGLSSSLL